MNKEEVYSRGDRMASVGGQLGRVWNHPGGRPQGYLEGPGWSLGMPLKEGRKEGRKEERKKAKLVFSQ
jgi:hypothetical protein